MHLAEEAAKADEDDSSLHALATQSKQDEPSEPEEDLLSEEDECAGRGPTGRYRDGARAGEGGEGGRADRRAREADREAQAVRGGAQSCCRSAQILQEVAERTLKRGREFTSRNIVNPSKESENIRRPSAKKNRKFQEKLL